VFLFIDVTSQLEGAVAEDTVTSEVTWHDVIARCKQYQQELEEDQQRDVKCSIESLLRAVGNAFTLRQTTSNNYNIDTVTRSSSCCSSIVNDNIDREADTEYIQILQ